MNMFKVKEIKQNDKIINIIKMTLFEQRRIQNTGKHL